MRHPGVFLQHDFMRPLGVSASALARSIGVPRSRLSEVIAGRRGITPDTARRLGMFFGVEPSVFLERQAAWDLAQLEPVAIEPADTSGFLVGPRGVTPLPDVPSRRRSRTARMNPEMVERLRAKAADTPSTGPRELVEVTYPCGQRVMESKVR